MLWTERGILSTEGGTEMERPTTSERTTLADLLLGGWLCARYGVLMFRLCGIVRTSSRLQECTIFMRGGTRRGISIDPRRGRSRHGNIHDVSVTKFYSPLMVCAREDVYSVNNLIMPCGIVQCTSGIAKHCKANCRG